ncbi:MAG TPA: sensor histidine kinase [Thiobacillaceae bacterium]|nr:sensor histidine kinase [Thiobacillaceae bacterium]HNU64240.1 sensor histidine kinase [Thiobacillaceae bacterium]
MNVMPPVPAKLLQRHGNRILALMLVLLHAAFVWGHGEPWGRFLILAHYLVFLVWQPFFSGLQRLGNLRILGVLAAGGVLMLLNSLLAAAFWTVLLAGLLAGVAMGLRSARERTGIWLGVLYLLLLLFLWLLPQGFGLAMRGARQVTLWRDSMLILPLIMVVFPSPEIRRHVGVVDLLYTLFFELFIAVLALGSYAAMRLMDTDYGHGVLMSLTTLAASLLLITWLWQPRGGDSSLRNLFSRYVLSLGLPLEEWLGDLSDAAERVSDPERFLRAAMLGFTSLPWSTGVTWKTPRSRDALGEHSPHAESFRHLDVEVTFFTDGPANPAFSLHLRLLTEIIGYFYAAKRREQEMQANAYSQAVYETGSRLTHDVKNLLQSLKALCSAAEYSQPEQAASLQTLMQRQLPQVAKRLEITLDKLKAPAQSVDKKQILAREWWRNVKNRYAQERLVFDIDDVDSALWLPQELFDSVADNLVQNALRKRVGEPEIRIRVALATHPLPTLTVCDTGHAAGEEVVGKLFQAPVTTHDGLGIGLYQAAKQAQEVGYRLELSSNREGYVCFTLWQETL